MKITMTFKVFALLLALLSLPSAFAQVVTQANLATLQPLISRDSKGFLSCGVRALVTYSTPNFVDAYDFSLVIDAEMFRGILKSGKLRMSTADLAKGKQFTAAVVPAPVNFWISKETDGIAISPKKIVPALTTGYIMGSADFAQTSQGIMDITEGLNMQFVTRYKNEPLDRVIAFSAVMPEHEMKPLSACIHGLLNRMKETLK